MSETHKTLTVYLIRHGESTSNVQFKILIDSLIGFLQARGYCWVNFTLFLETFWNLLFEYEPNSQLSELGMRQARGAGKYFREELLGKLGNQPLYAHSELNRAKLTASLVCGQQHYDVLADLNEANKTEHVVTSLIYDRVRRFEKWLAQAENNSVIVVVGHAQYFKYMLGRSDHMYNCDIWRLQPSISIVSEGRVLVNWGSSELIYRSPQSYVHPLNRLKSILLGKGDIAADDGNCAATMTVEGSAVESDSQQSGKEDRTCRICQETESETPGSCMIRPCRCTGTLSHVHISCLNEWRSTSSSASFQCYVCRYSYRVERTALASFLMDDRGSTAIAVGLIFTLVVLAGLLSLYVIRPLTTIDICAEVCHRVEWKMWWRSCSYHRLRHNHNGVRLLRNLLGIEFESIRAAVLCSQVLVVVMEIMLSGCIVVGIVGGLQYIYGEIMKFLRTPGRHDMQHLALMGVWVLAMSSTGLARIGIWIGVAFACREIYTSVLIYGRKIGQMIGETILEPNT